MHAVRRFLRTPKGLLTVVLVLLAGAAAPGEGLAVAAPGLIGAAGGAAVMDLLILRRWRGGWEFPSGAILTGLIVAMVLSPHEPWYVAACTAAIAVASKYLVRTRSANVFNPAALALVITTPLFESGQSWWGALPSNPPLALVLLLVTGIFIADRVNKMPLVLAFLGVYYLLFTSTAFVGDPGEVAEVFRTPDLEAVLFFAFFMLTDPPTAPVRYPQQLACGAIVAVASVAFYEAFGVVYFLLAGVLVGNIWEAWNRTTARGAAQARAAALET